MMAKISKAHYFLITLFTIIILLPVADYFGNFSPVKELFEKRLPAQKPHISWAKEDIISYPRQFEKFYNDNFGFRKTLIYLNSNMMDKLFDQSPASNAVFGRDGWLYFSNKGSLLDVQGQLHYDQKTLEQGIAALVGNWQMLKKMGIDYVLIIAPDKSSIYPEYLPDYMAAGSTTRLDQFLSAMNKSHPDFPLIDLRKPLLAAKKNAVIYHKTDTHWNRLGTYFAYEYIMQFLSKKHPQLKATPLEQFIFEPRQWRGDIADIMNLSLTDNYDELLPRQPFTYYDITTKADAKRFHKPDFIANKNKNLPVLLSYKDSFMDNLIYFLSNHFSASHYINEFPCELNPEIVKEYRPNIVIQQMWEGRMQEVLESCK